MRDTFSYGSILERYGSQAYAYLEEHNPEVLEKANEPRALDVTFLTHQDDIDGSILDAIIRANVGYWEENQSGDEGGIYQMFAEISSALDNGNCPDSTRRWLLGYIEDNEPTSGRFSVEWSNLDKTLRYYLGA